MNILLYGLTVVIWGSTWLAIKYQLAVVHPTLSIFYRFALASVILLTYTYVRGFRLRYPASTHRQFLLMGAFMYSTNYACFYFAETNLSTGLVAIVFALSLPMNAFFARAFFHRKIGPEFVVGGLIGIAGMAFLFWPQLVHFDLTLGSGQAIVLSLAGTMFFSIGNLISGKSQARGIPVLQSAGYSMAYGAALMLPFALFFPHNGVYFELSTTYIISLIYLALFGSVIGFAAYLTLLGRIGGERAAYATVLFPVVALILSTIFEGFEWTLRDFVGITLILLGNILVLTKPTWATSIFNVPRR